MFSVYHDNTFPFFREFNVCSVENLSYISNLGRYKECLKTKDVGKANQVDPGDRVILPVKFACKPELT